MNGALSQTLQHGDFDSVFQEIEQPERISWTTEGELRLFHLLISDNEISIEDLKSYVYRIIGDYVFSRARIPAATWETLPFMRFSRSVAPSL